jgi:hypothetical protein
MMFKFVVRHLGFLKHIPLLAWLVDALMLIWNSAMNRDIPKFIDQIEEDVSSWDGITLCIHRFGGIQFNYRGEEIGHIHSNGILDILFSRKVRQELVDAGRAAPHHVLPNTGWVSFYVLKEDDVERAIRLLKTAYRMRLALRLNSGVFTQMQYLDLP